MSPDTPLSKADISNARNGCYECDLCQREAERMAALGLDVTEEEARLEHLKRFFQGVVDQYGPLVGRPRPTSPPS